MAMKELQHGSHECVLTSPEKGAIGICNICFKDESVEFSCIPCNFDLCEACSNLPHMVSHEFHSEHPLEFCLRKVDQKPEHILCSGCGTMSSGSFYKCRECEIYLDLECALLPNIFKSWDTKPELHYSHAHLLKRCRPGPDVKGSCLLCELPLSPSSLCYGCIHCYSFTHERCLDFPMEIQHPVHPAHPLKRLDFTQNCGDISCKCCRNKIASVPIGCLECNFHLHLRCADSLLRGLMHKSHQHMLLYVATGALVVFESSCCEICKRIGVISLKSFYQCVECGWKIHFECFEIPRSVAKKKFHIHPLACKIFLGEEDDSLEYCGVCETMVHVGHHAYSCKECDYVGHIECILRMEAPSPLYLKDLFSCEKDLTRGTNREDCETGKLENKLMVNDIEHIHVLRWGHLDGKSCDICKGSISSSSWKCETCGFTAHDSCAKLGKPSRHRPHLIHDLTLMPSYPAGIITNCNTCKTKIDGYNLLCRICSIITCMKCVVRFNQLLGELRRGQKFIGTTEGICRQSYSHTLSQVLVSSSYPIACTFCEERLCGKVVSCMECGDIYHPLCAGIFSTKLFYPFHPDHKLEMQLQSGSKCIACKLNTTKYELFCSVCEVSFHIKCSIAFDGPGKSNLHKHTFYNFWIKDSMVTQACSVCGRLCCDSFYGCIDCNFSAHVECLGFPANVKSHRHRHVVVEKDYVWYETQECKLCRLDCVNEKYYCKQCKDVFHKKCILSQDAPEAVTEEGQLEDIYIMYVERLILDMFEEEEKEEWERARIGERRDL